jgi:Bacterial PH domain
VTDDASGPVPPTTAWAPRWGVVAAVAASGVALGVLAGTSLSGDGAGAILAAAAAVVVLAVAAYDATVRPTLVADPDGIAVRQGWQPRRYPWPAVTRIEVVTTRRLLVLHALEIDAGDDLLLLSSRRLGTDLTSVADLLDDYRAARVD